MKTDKPGALLPEVELEPAKVPPGVDRRTFMMRSAVIGSAAVITGCTMPEKQQTAAASAPPPVVKEPISADLDVVRRSKGFLPSTPARSRPSPLSSERSTLQRGRGPWASETPRPR